MTRSIFAFAAVLSLSTVGAFMAPRVVAQTILPPVAVITASGSTTCPGTAPCTAHEGDTVNLSGSQSTDPQGEALRYAFAQISGPTALVIYVNGNFESISVPSVGGAGAVMTFQLTVTNTSGLSSNPAATTVTIIRTLPNVPVVSCTGFQAPFSQAISLSKKSNRAIPLVAQLFDANNSLQTPATLNAAPVVDVTYNAGVGPATDETTLLDPLGQSSSGNQFNFDSTTGNWWFNLSSSTFTASGTYTVRLLTGDASQYTVSPSCAGTFVRP